MIYIYIYRERERERERERGWVQAIHGVTLNNVIPPNNLLLNSFFENPMLNYMFYMFLTCMPIFMPIRCNLPIDP